MGKKGQKFPKLSKNYNIPKWAENPTKSDKFLKQKAIPSFLGDIGLIKMVSEFSFGHTKYLFLALLPKNKYQKVALQVQLSKSSQSKK